MKTEEAVAEMMSLGTGLYLAQRIEFALYGIAAHLSHLPEAQADKRLKALNGEQFLRGDLRKLKLTFGQLVRIFGDRLLLASPDLDALVEDRNLIVHNYYRHFHTSFDGNDRSGEAVIFLQSYCDRAQRFLCVVEGLLVMLKEAFALREGRSHEIKLTDREETNKLAYLSYVHKHSNLIMPT